MVVHRPDRWYGINNATMDCKSCLICFFSKKPAVINYFRRGFVKQKINLQGL